MRCWMALQSAFLITWRASSVTSRVMVRLRRLFGLIANVFRLSCADAGGNTLATLRVAHSKTGGNGPPDGPAGGGVPPQQGGGGLGGAEPRTAPLAGGPPPSRGGRGRGRGSG